MKRRLSMIAAFCLTLGCAPVASAQSEAGGAALPRFVMTNAEARDGTDLSGTWTYSIDPYRDGMAGFHGGEAGEGHRRYDPRDVDEITRQDPTALYEYDMRRSPEATLPGSWTKHAPEMRHYQGLVWYQRAFDAAPKRGERAFIRVGAANYRTQVYLNGQLVGEHEGGFTPFTMEVTDVLKEGENRIVLGVDSARDEASVPPPVTDWETYGGVTRAIRLVTVPETFVDDAWVRLERDGQIRATVELEGPGAGGKAVEVGVPELGLTLSGETDETGIAHLAAPAPDALERWSPETPKLYEVSVAAGDDVLPERIGFRTLSVEGDRILLNGEPIFLRGISMHEEELGENPARIMTEDAARALLTEIKEGLHGNFVRLAHYPHSEATLRLADEMGLIVWSEVPVYWRIDWENEATLAVARGMVAENLLRDRNRASIALWSVANETPVSEARNRFLETLIGDVRRLDPTRLVTAALLSESQEEDGTVVSEIADPLAASLDVLAINTYNGWYGGLPLEEVSEVRWRSVWDKPLIFSEFGAGALAGFHDPKLERKFSEEYQADVYRETLEMAREVPFLAGMSPWILKDFRSPRRQHPLYQQGWNRKGLISETGERKEAFGVLAAEYQRIAEEGRE
ncbi:glycoside hydrolase family 2 protein [Parvularcula dongshanensis]|uniref:Beta-glucuronidase n=1 Tax=Parvularcula dongshanensis TaxID=1173995 RepID=A0A840I391_9PROT|nr:glycoside hydrolase family 2 TIM barrel-domain containing protein [Parvularcula dongshanensis]MBB4658674.1 beta-glucuronidase [Parvularcula dongshanensis]